ncbi:predicted ORF [Xanthomonas phage XacN1]|nr:predicted ORF [Xanthomonas phage XacN1]BBA65668.1 predicted ORF [Xanthomonas phage XacN1]
MPYIILIAGLYLLSLCLMHTSNFKSAVFFKAIPFILGSLLTYHAVKSLGWLALL